MQVEMNGGIIVAIAIVLIGILVIGLAVYYIRKGRAERAQANSEASVSEGAEVSAVKDLDD